MRTGPRHTSTAGQQGNATTTTAASRPPRSPRAWAVQLALAAALLAALGLGAPSAKAAGIYDNMEYLAKHAPPAIVHLRDRALRLLYAQEILDLWDNFDCVSYRLESDYGGCFFDDVIVDSSSRNTEPALHLLVTTPQILVLPLRWKYQNPWGQM